MDSIEERVKKIIVEQLGSGEDIYFIDVFDTAALDEDASFTDDLDVDFFVMDEIIMALEEEFDIDIPEEKAEKLDTVAKMITYVKKRLKSEN